MLLADAFLNRVSSSQMSQSHSNAQLDVLPVFLLPTAVPAFSVTLSIKAIIAVLVSVNPGSSSTIIPGNATPVPMTALNASREEPVSPAAALSISELSTELPQGASLWQPTLTMG